MLHDYTTCLLLTQQFRFCGNSFRADTYMGCEFQCKYCFSTFRNYTNYRNDGDRQIVIRGAKFNEFKKAYDSINSEKVGSVIGKLNQEMLNHRVPIHLGGLADPFQKCEFNEGITYSFLELFKDYPVVISTKTDYLPEKYFDILNPKYKTFQISLFTDNDLTLRLFENNTPSSNNRIEFIKELKKRGYWVALRIQPIIHIEEALSLIEKLKDIVDYITVEHLKIPSTKYGFELMKLLGKQESQYVFRRTYYKLPVSQLAKNISKIKSIYKGNLGVGDNELLTETTNCNCCGLDCMPKEFDNWLKYNYLNIAKTGHKNHWIPDCDIKTGIIDTNTFNRLNGSRKIKDYVDKYSNEIYKTDEVNLFNSFKKTE